MIGVNDVPPIPPRRGDREGAAAHVTGGQLARAGGGRQLAEFARDLKKALLVGLLDHRDNEAAGGVGRKADVVIALAHELVAVQRRVEVRELLERGNRGQHQEGDHRHLHVISLLVQLLAPGLELGDVRLVVLGDVRDHRPVAREVWSGDLLDAAAWHPLDRAELLGVNRRPRREVEACDACCSRGGGRTGSGRRGLLDVLAGDPALAPAPGRALEIHPQLTREAADRRAGVHGSV